MPLPMFLAIGVCAGVLAGIFGVGGGLIIVPALTILAKFPQKEAAGTSLVALLLPIGIAGVYAYYKDGALSKTDIKVGLLIASGMFFGAWFGAKIALMFPDYILKRTFCIFLILVAARMWIQTLPKGE